MAKVKTVITDLDKTLLRTDETVSEYTRAVLDACRGRRAPSQKMPI